MQPKNLQDPDRLPRESISPIRPLFGWGAALIAVASSAVLLMHAYLGTYSRFMADDYCSASVGLRLGVLRAAWFWYRTWTGRYSASVLDATFGTLGPAVTPSMTAIVLVVWLGCLFAAVLLYSRSEAGHDKTLFAFSLAAAILFLTLALAPNVPQALYWGQGMRSVVPPLIAITLDAALFASYRMRTWPLRRTIVWMALSAVLAFGAGGFSETYAALQVVMFGLAILVFLLGGRRAAKSDLFFLSSGLAGAMLSITVIVLAPGNAARAALYPAPPGLFDLLRISLRSYGVFLSQIVSSPLKIIALATSPAIGLWFGIHSDIGPRGWRAALWILLIGVILSFSCFPPAAYGESTVPPDRTLLIPTYILVITFLLSGGSLARPVARYWRGLVPISYAVILFLWLAAALSLSQMASAQPKYAAYAALWRQFNSEMIGFRQAGVETAVISTADQKANNWAGLNTLGDTTRFWLNKCVGDYYGVKVISTTP